MGKPVPVQEDGGAYGAAERVQGRERVWERKVDEYRFVVEGQGEVEHEVDTQPERGRVCSSFAF